jgi:hypothetical protein
VSLVPGDESFVNADVTGIRGRDELPGVPCDLEDHERNRQADDRIGFSERVDGQADVLPPVTLHRREDELAGHVGKVPFAPAGDTCQVPKAGVEPRTPARSGKGVLSASETLRRRIEPRLKPHGEREAAIDRCSLCEDATLRSR